MPSGGGGGSTTVQKADPWSGVQPYLTGQEGKPGVYPEAANLYQNNPLQFYPGQTYADFSPETQLGLAGQANRALAGSPITTSMQNELQKTLEGQYLANNPQYEQVAAKVLPQIDARFGASGRSDSALASRAASEGLTAGLADIYDKERNRQMQAMLFAPQAANQDYYDLAKLSEVGGVKEDLAQQKINEAMQRYQFNNRAPWDTLAMYQGALQGTYGPSNITSSTNQRRSLGSNLLGGGLAGAGLGLGANQLFNLGLSNTTAGVGGGLIGGLAGGLL